MSLFGVLFIPPSFVCPFTLPPLCQPVRVFAVANFRYCRFILSQSLSSTEQKRQKVKRLPYGMVAFIVNFVTDQNLAALGAAEFG